MILETLLKDHPYFSLCLLVQSWVFHPPNWWLWFSHFSLPEACEGVFEPQISNNVQPWELCSAGMGKTIRVCVFLNVCVCWEGVFLGSHSERQRRRETGHILLILVIVFPNNASVYINNPFQQTMELGSHTHKFSFNCYKDVSLTYVCYWRLRTVRLAL